MLRRLMCIRVQGSMVQGVPPGILVHAAPPGGSMHSGVMRHARCARKHVCGCSAALPAGWGLHQTSVLCFGKVRSGSHLFGSRGVWLA